MIKAVTVSTEKKQRKRAPDNTGRKQGEPASAKAAVPTHPKAEPTERDRREASDAKARILSRRKRVQVKATGDGTEMKLDASHADHAGWSTQLKDAFGTTSHDFMARSVSLLATAMQRSGQGRDEGINAWLAVVAGVRPENETEAMLAVQMAATHEAAMSMLDIARGNGAVPAMSLRIWAFRIQRRNWSRLGLLWRSVTGLSPWP